MADNLQGILANEVRLLLLPLAVAADGGAPGQLLLEVTGWNVAAGSDPATSNQLVEFANAYQALDNLITSPPETLADVLNALATVKQIFTALHQVSAQPATQDLENLAKDLIQALLIDYLKNWHPAIHDVLALLTVIQPPVGISLDRIPDLLKDPVQVLRGEYLQPQGLATAEDAQALAAKLFPRLASLFGDFGFQAAYTDNPENGQDLGEIANHVSGGMLTVFLQPEFETGKRYGLNLALSSRDLGNFGLVVMPFGEILPYWDVDIDLTAAAPGFAIGPQGLTMFGTSDSGNVRVSPGVVSLPGVLVGSATGTRFEIGQFQISGDAKLDTHNQEYGLLLDMGKSSLVIAGGDGDGFIQSILPAGGIRADLDLAIGWSNKNGFYFAGSATLDATLLLGISIGGALIVPSAHLLLQAADAGVVAEVSATVRLSIGPVQVVVDRVGIISTFTFPDDHRGNLGVVDVSVGFKPPNGLGLVVDAEMVTGGGYISFDPRNAQYSGVLDLQIVETIAVKAIAVLTTRLPDGSNGFSLVAIIFAEGFTPIQLGLGFALTGIGGLLAINRTFDENVLRAGLKNHILDSILFAPDPVRNAPQIISNLNKVFPPANGHHLFGPMAQISWGTPALVTADLALILEIGARLRLLILAQIAAILPTHDNDLLRLQMDAIGVIDFDQGTAAIDATLHDSRLLNRFAITGDMAMRLAWKGSRNFALAVGGLHPAFNPPPNFPKLDRVAINLSSGDNPRIRCEAYFAITANTEQFGANAELYASAAGFSIHGEIGYDVLFQLDPFGFVADFHAQVQLMRGSTNLFKVKVVGELAGPLPLHVKAKATFEILWWDVSVSIDRTLVGGDTPPQLPPVDVLPLLRTALADPGNWTGQLPARQRPVATIRAGAAISGGISVHPLAVLTVKQNVVPLDLEISRFGQATPAGATQFSITTVTLGAQNQSLQTIRDFFAPAQFLELSDDEKLSRPSFESMTAGLTFSSSDFVFTNNSGDWLEVPGIDFETIILDKDSDISRPSDTTGPQNRYRLTVGLLAMQSRFGAASSSGLRRTGDAKYRTTAAKYRVEKEGWNIVKTDDLTVQPLPGVAPDIAASYSEAEQSLRTLAQGDPKRARSLKILRLSDLAGAAR